MSSCDAAVVAPTLFDALRLGRSAQVIVAPLLRFWDSRNIKEQDIVGMIRSVQGSDLKDAGVMTRVVVRFVIEPSMEIYLSLWDEPAVKFRGLLKSGDRTNSVILVTTVIPLKTGGTLHSTGTMFVKSSPATNFFWDPNLPPITEFTARCQGEEFPCFQTSNTNAAPLFKKDIGQASVSPNTEIEGQEDDTITSVKDKEVHQIRTRE
ncbi:hypothetical protein HID58_043692 [Brassica napus]|uniref:Uncharacterized protein n=1 Tax=Brassica napus TaxID=3708 RepID=A0ABQ8BH90_BRANA|nr:hypothetical protein HID58_043692 [Brassica napus]